MISDVDVAAVRSSYGRVIAKGKFVERFYELFLKSSSEVKRMFAHTDLGKQSELLERSLTMSLLFPQGNLIARQVVDKIRASHSRKNLNVNPALYKLWLDSLIKVVAERDPECTPELEQQWRRVMQVTLDYITEGY